MRWAPSIAKRYKLICFDEFHVADITDAMILYRLLVALFDNGVGFVTTSNFVPDGLYPDGLHRDRILPAIALLNERMEVVNVDNGTDYRRRTLEQVQALPLPAGAAGRCGHERSVQPPGQLCPMKNRCFTIESRQITGARRAAAKPCGSISGDAVRRPALAKRLPGNRQPVPYGAALERAVHAGEYGLRRHGASPG